MVDTLETWLAWSRARVGRVELSGAAAKYTRRPRAALGAVGKREGEAEPQARRTRWAEGTSEECASFQNHAGGEGLGTPFSATPL